MESLAQLTPDGKTMYVYLIPVMRNGKPWKFIRRPEDIEASRIDIKVDDRPTIMLNGLPWKGGE